jgi:hypothetical protein
VTNTYTGEFNALEAALAKLKFDMTVDMEEPFHRSASTEERAADTAETRRHHFAWVLGYGRTDAETWGLVVSHFRVDEGPGGKLDWIFLEKTALRRAPRELRVAATAQIPALVEKLQKRVAEKIDRVRKAKAR